MGDYEVLTANGTESSIPYFNVTATDPELLEKQAQDLLRRYETNRRLSDGPFYAFIAAYALLIVIGAIGNCLVVSAVIRKATMRTARNMFIINLAVSDLLLCVITMPLTLIEILTMYWPFGKSPFPCKVYGSLQAISIFVSTISITAIALDRYHVIVYPTQASVQRVGAVIVLVLIWLISCILTSPLFLVRTVENTAITGLGEINYCFEKWTRLNPEFNDNRGRAYYSIFAMVFQYVLPIVVVSISYLMIWHKLRNRMKPGANDLKTEGKSRGRKGTMEKSASDKAKDTRVRKTNMLLISIAIMFFISWMPLNVFNVVMDLLEQPISDPETYYICYAICHMIGMSSACSNPVLYGWLNENFRKEFIEIAHSLKSCYSKNVNNNSNGRGRDGLRRGSSFKGGGGGRGGGPDKDLVATVHFKNNKATLNVTAVDCEQTTLITHVVDQHN